MEFDYLGLLESFFTLCSISRYLCLYIFQVYGKTIVKVKTGTQSKSRRNNKRDDHCNKSDYILINLVWYHRVFMGDGTI